MSEPILVENRSKLKDLIASIATIHGDLSNITAPPFILDTKSSVELPAFWAERPVVFVAPAASQNPAERALLVLKWFVSSLRNQQYAGRSESQGVKKPINSFLGEVFLANWEDEAGLTRLVSEQVSHHPPVTACRVWNEEHGVSAEGYTRQEITFTGNVNIKQIGHATLQIARYDETYLIPLPDIKIKGILSGSLYPELEGSYTIPSTSGYTSTIDFSGKGLFSSSDKKHSFEARVYRDGEEESFLYTISGNWDGQFTIHDCARDAYVETFDVTAAPTTPLKTGPLEDQDPWESRRAWKDVREALQTGNMQAAADAKAAVENGQRRMRKTDDDGKRWNRLFYRAEAQTDEVTLSLSRKIGVHFKPEDTVGAWKFRRREWDEGVFQKPYHGDSTPENTRGGSVDMGVQGEGKEERGSINGVSPIAAAVAADAGAHNSSSSQKQGAERQALHTPSSQPEIRNETAHSNTNGIPLSSRPPPSQTPHPTQTDPRKESLRETPLELSEPSRFPMSERPEDALNEADLSRTQTGVEGMSVQEKTAVEEMLRDRYGSQGGGG